MSCTPRIFTLLCLLSLTACGLPNRHQVDITQGQYHLPLLIDNIKVGQKKADVTRAFGRPLHRPLIHADQRWVYYSQHRKLDKLYIRTFEITFDRQDRVKTIKASPVKIEQL